MEKIYGTDIPRTNLVDWLYGEGGSDQIFGLAGPDRIEGGGGHDYLVGWSGNDTIYGQDGNDRIFGDSGNDILDGGTQDDWIEGRQDNDNIAGGDGADILWSWFPYGEDQPYNGSGETAGWHDMFGTGPHNDGDCDLEDNWPDPECITGGKPVASDDGMDNEYSVSHAGPALVVIEVDGVLTNDAPVTGQGDLKVGAILAQPAYGALSWNQNGSFTYTPSGTFVGDDWFVYRLHQGTVPLVSDNVGVVKIKVTNEKPVVGPPEEPMTSWTMPVVIPALDYDSDPDGDDIDLVDPPGANQITDPPDSGTISVNHETGYITYTYTGPDPEMEAQDHFTYKVKDNWDESIDSVTVTIKITGSMLLLDLPPVEAKPDTRAINQADVALMAGEAARRWIAAGVDPAAARQALAATEFVVADLPGSILGMEAPGRIVIDVNGAGYGWFVDSTPGTDDEFSIFVSPSELQARNGSPALGKADLLTALMHELGHTLGMVHLEGGEFQHSVMHDALGLSMRRVPTAADIIAADEFFASLGEGSTRRRRR